jgi:hypothetical protein
LIRTLWIESLRCIFITHMHFMNRKLAKISELEWNTCMTNSQIIKGYYILFLLHWFPSQHPETSTPYHHCTTWKGRNPFLYNHVYQV